MAGGLLIQYRLYLNTGGTSGSGCQWLLMSGGLLIQYRLYLNTGGTSGVDSGC